MRRIENWLSDLPQQFQNKKNIEILISAFNKQLEEVQSVFDDMDNKTDLNNAEGRQLDFVGNIVNLSRKDAGILLGLGMSAPVISDERYRNLLAYKALSNTSDCTYSDLMESLEILWQTEGIKYYEDPKRPATIYLILPKADFTENLVLPFERKLVVKASGVSVLYKLIYTTEIDVINREKFGFVSFKNKMEFPFWKGYKTFDGSFCFDGSELFHGAEYPDYKLYPSIRFSEKTIEKFERLRNFIELKMNIREWTCFVAKHRNDVNTKEKTELVEIKNKAYVKNNERMEGTVTVNNLWYFDGSFCFDGTKLWNASIRKEQL